MGSSGFDFIRHILCQPIEAIAMHVRDFRNCLVQVGDNTSHVNKSLIVHKALLEMSMENVIKDISSMSDDS